VYQWTGEESLLNQHIFRVVPDNKKVCLPYLKHALENCLHDMERYTHGSTMKHINRKEFLETKAWFPPLNEQRRIAAILDKADAVRRKRQQALTLVNQVLRSSFLEMFGDPETNPMGWEKSALNSIADIQIGHPFQSQQYVKDGVRLLRGANVLPGKLAWDDVCFWSKNDVARYRQFFVQCDDVVVALDRPWISSGFKVARVLASDTPALLVQRVARLRSDVRGMTDLWIEVLKHESFSRYCKPTETTIPHISPVELKEYPMITPPESLVIRFHAIAKRLREREESLNQQTQLDDILMSSLAHKAFSGEM
jgi:type I restriction enzyme S subunit